MWGLDVVALPDHSDVTLYVTFTPRCYVIRVRQDGPLVVKLMLWDGCQSIRTMHVRYDQLLVLVSELQLVVYQAESKRCQHPS